MVSRSRSLACTLAATPPSIPTRSRSDAALSSTRAVRVFIFARSTPRSDAADEEFERLVLEQLEAAVRQFDASWDERRRRDFVVQVLMSSLGDEQPDGNNSWPSVDRISLRGIKTICKQLALDVVEGPRVRIARAHMVEEIQCALWDLWERTQGGAESKQQEGLQPMDSQSDGEDQPPHPAGAAAAAEVAAAAGAAAAEAAAAAGAVSSGTAAASPSKNARASARVKVHPPPLAPFRPPPRPVSRRQDKREAAVPSQLGLPDNVAAVLASLPSSSQPSAPGRKSADVRRSPPRARSARPVSVQAPLALFAGDPDEPGGDSTDGSSSESDGDGFDPSDPFGVLGKARRSARGRARRDDLDEEMESSGHTAYMAKQYIQNVLRSSGGTSVHRVFKDDVKFKHERNRRECLALARIVDAALRNDAKQLLELAVRRLAGVHTADTSDNNWDACDAIEQVMERQSFVPTKFLQRALKTVVQLHALQKQSDHGSEQKKNKKNRARGGEGRGGNAPPASEGSAGAAASAAKKAAGGGSSKP